MSVDINEVKRIKERADTLRAEAERAAGAADAALAKLKEEFGVATLAEAEAKLVAMDTEVEAAEAAYNEALAAFKAEWGDLLR